MAQVLRILTLSSQTKTNLYALRYYRGVSINRQLVDIQHGHVWRNRPVRIIALLSSPWILIVCYTVCSVLWGLSALLMDVKVDM